jgi:ureidoacrylate peracid hydrolase
VGKLVLAPDGRDSQIMIKDSWNTDILPDLAPQDADIVVSKHRFSGFFETDLDATLKELGVTSLIFTGCTTSICVESTLRDAFFRDYRCLLLEDCTAEPIGSDLPRTNHDASVRVIETLFGWVTDSVAFEAVLRQPTAAAT